MNFSGYLKGARPVLPSLAACLAAAFAVSLAATPAHSQDKPWPSQTIKIIVPFAAGGVTDVLARVLTDRLSKSLNQSVIADNRPGAGSTLGAAIAATAKPDGYTLMLMSTSHLFAPVMYKNLPYDMLTDFTPISRLVSSSFAMAVNGNLPVKNVQEFIALAKSKPGELNYGSSGNGGNQHLVGAMFVQATGIDVKHVPYKGSAPVTADLMGGQVQMAFMAVTNAIPHIKSGRLRVIGVTSEQRLPELLAVPTLNEAGVPGFKATFWLGLVAPKGTPPAIVARLDEEMRKIVQAPDVKQILAAGGLDVDVAPTAEFATFLRDENVKWLKLARSVNLTE